MKQQEDIFLNNFGLEITLICSVIFLVYILRDFVLILKARQSASEENRAPASYSLLFDFLFLICLLHMISTLNARIW